MNKIAVFLFFIYFWNVDCRRHHRHKKPTSQQIATADALATSYDDRNFGFPDSYTAPAPAPATQYNNPIYKLQQYVYPNSLQNSLPNSLPNSLAPNTLLPTGKLIAPAPTNSAVARDLDLIHWKNHSIPYLKEFKDEVDFGKIKHHNYEELTWFMKYFAEEYPDIAKLYNLGECEH